MESEDLKDEIGAIEAIYPDSLERLAPRVYKFNVPQHEQIQMSMSFPKTYPQEEPSILDVVSNNEGYDDAYLKGLFQEVLDSVYFKGSVVVFDLFSELDGILYNEEDEEEAQNDDHWDEADQVAQLAKEVEKTTIESEEEEETVVDYTHYQQKAKKAAETKTEKPVDPFKGWTISEMIKDRKSTFVGFAREVHSVEDVNTAIAALSRDSKIEKANHLMQAYRIKEGDSDVIYEDCDDDGEAAAGSRLLHLLGLMDACNVVVVVARWFGGVHLGPVRFRHINECARDALVKGNLVERKKDGKKSKGKKKKK